MLHRARLCLMLDTFELFHPLHLNHQKDLKIRCSCSWALPLLRCWLQGNWLNCIEPTVTWHVRCNGMVTIWWAQAQNCFMRNEWLPKYLIKGRFDFYFRSVIQGRMGIQKIYNGIVYILNIHFRTLNKGLAYRRVPGFISQLL